MGRDVYSTRTRLAAPRAEQGESGDADCIILRRLDRDRKHRRVPEVPLDVVIGVGG